MEPITLATVTSALTVMASEFAKGSLSEAGKDAWSKIKGLFGWKAEPAAAELAPRIAQHLQQDDQLARQVILLLREQPVGTASTLVGSIDAEKVVVADTINVSGDLNM